MTFNYLGILLAFAFPLLLGWNFLNIVDRGQRGRFFCLENLFISFGLGMGLLTLTMFYMSLFGINLSFVSVSLLACLRLVRFACVDASVKHPIR